MKRRSEFQEVSKTVVLCIISSTIGEKGVIKLFGVNIVQNLVRVNFQFQSIEDDDLLKTLIYY